MVGQQLCILDTQSVHIMFIYVIWPHVVHMCVIMCYYVNLYHSIHHMKIIRIKMSLK